MVGKKNINWAVWADEIEWFAALQTESYPWFYLDLLNTHRFCSISYQRQRYVALSFTDLQNL